MFHCSYPSSALFYVSSLASFSLLYLSVMFFFFFPHLFLFLHFLATSHVLFTCLVHYIVLFRSFTPLLQRTEIDLEDLTNTNIEFLA